jgi:diguanylate cyclase (GGDEF)-like protein
MVLHALRERVGSGHYGFPRMSDAERDTGAHADENGGHAQHDLRQRISASLSGRAEIVAADAVAIFPFGGGDGLDEEYCRRVGTLLAHLLGNALRDGRLDARNALVGDLHRVALERAVPLSTLFSFAYLTERTALDELALDHTIGATSEAWPLVAQLVRRASFDLLGAYAEHAQLDPAGAAILDRLTTLHTRPVFDVALAKALDRAGRFGDAISIVLFDVDRLSQINRDYGYGVGDRVLERLGILIKAFFRQHDWVARYSEDAIAVILSRTDPQDAMVLAERVRVTIEERLEFLDHRTDTPVRVTLSAAVVNVGVQAGEVLDAERVMADAEAALDRAKRDGRNRVERVDSYSRSS